MVAAREEQSVSRHSQATAIEQIASVTGAPLDAVREIYDREIESLSSEARITQFVGVIATRRVLLKLRQH